MFIKLGHRGQVGQRNLPETGGEHLVVMKEVSVELRGKVPYRNLEEEVTGDEEFDEQQVVPSSTEK